MFGICIPMIPPTPISALPFGESLDLPGIGNVPTAAILGGGDHVESDQHQVFGRMSGTAILDDGTRLEIKDLLCFAEDVHNMY